MNKTQTPNVLQKLQQLSKYSLRDWGLVEIYFYFYVHGCIFLLEVLISKIRIVRIGNHKNLKQKQRRLNHPLYLISFGPFS